jgi:hypothetical protein
MRASWPELAPPRRHSFVIWDGPTTVGHCRGVLLNGSVPACAERGRSTGCRYVLVVGVVRLAGPDGPGGGVRWRVFISHTSELRDYPKGQSYVAAVERAVSAAGHVIVDMKDFPAADQTPAQLCADLVRGCEIYVGVLGTRYGSPVPDKSEVSYTELEFDTATEAGLERLVFVLDTNADNVGIPVSALIDDRYGARQAAFRARVQGGLVVQSFTDPATLGQLVERSLRELIEQRRRTGSGTGGGKPLGTIVVGEIPQEPLGVAGIGGACADRDAGGGQDPPGRGVRAGAD